MLAKLLQKKKSDAGHGTGPLFEDLEETKNPGVLDKLRKAVTATKVADALSNANANKGSLLGLPQKPKARQGSKQGSRQASKQAWNERRASVAEVVFGSAAAEERIEALEDAKRLADKAYDELLRNNYEQALKLAEKALKTDRKLVKALRVCCQVHIKKKLFHYALHEAKRLTATENPHESDFTDRAVAKIGLRDFDGAIEDCDEAIKINRIYVRAMYERGRAKYYKFDFDGCIKECTDAINIDNMNPSFWSLRAMAKQGLYNNSGAIDDCNEAIRIDYKHATAWSTRGDARNDLDDNVGAVKDITIALKLEREDARVWSNRADANEALKNYDTAVKDATEAIKWDPHLYDAYGRRGEAKFGLGDLKGAIQDCDKAVELNKLDKDAWQCSAKAKYIRGFYDEARKYAEGALAVDEEYSECEEVIWKTKEAHRVIAAWHVPLVTENRARLFAQSKPSSPEGTRPISAGGEMIRVGNVVATYRPPAMSGSGSSPALTDVSKYNVSHVD